MSYTHQNNSKTTAGLRNLGIVVTLLAVLLSSTATPLVFDAVTAQNSQSATVQGTVQATSEDQAGLRRVIITTPQGAKIYVNLTDDMAAGDTVSGTVFAEVSGKTDAEKAARAADLGNYLVEIAGQRIPATGKAFELKIPAALPDGNLPVILRDMKDKEAAKVHLPVASQTFAPETKMKLPTYGQAGGFIEIGCPCNGQIADSDYVKVGENKILVLAESPRKIVAFNTSTEQGLKEIEVSERGQITKGQMSILGIMLSVGKQSLLRGEKTTLTVEVTGLEGLREPVPLRLVNQTTTIMTMEPANRQELTINPADVQRGRFTTRRTLTGIQVGAFIIEGTVIRKEEMAPATENRTAAKRADNETGLPARRLSETGGDKNPPTEGMIRLTIGIRAWNCFSWGWGCLIIRLPGPWLIGERLTGLENTMATPTLEGEAKVRDGAQPTLNFQFNSAQSKDIRAIPVDRDVPLDGSIAESLGFKSVTILSGKYPIDPGLGKSGGVAFKVSVRKAWKADPRNPDNPFDSTGRRHNEALDYLLSRKDKFVVNGIVMKDAVINELSEKICADEIAPQPASQRKMRADCVIKVAQHMDSVFRSSRESLDKVNLSVKFNEAQIETLKEIEVQIGWAFDKSGKGPDAAIRNIKAIETRVLRTMSQGDSETKEIILKSSSIARYTIAYWYDENLDNYGRWRGVGGDQLKARKAYNDDKAAKADFYGAVEGGIAGFFTGGPFGAVTGVVGGSIGCSVVNIGQQLGWW